VSSDILYRIDQVAEEFGLPMGPFKLRDLVGFDVSVAVGGVAEVAYADRVFRSSLLKVCVLLGRIFLTNDNNTNILLYRI